MLTNPEFILDRLHGISWLHGRAQRRDRRDANRTSTLSAGNLARSLGATVRIRARVRRLPDHLAGIVLAHPAAHQPRTAVRRGRAVPAPRAWAHARRQPIDPTDRARLRPQRTAHPPALRHRDRRRPHRHRPRLGTDAIVPALLDTLLLHILRSLLDQQPTPGTTTGWAAALNDPATNAALQAIHRAPARPWTVAMLAAEAGLSRAPFARRFTTLVGQPPLTYLTWWRMTTAARLLQQSDAPLSAIAARVGYTSEFAFANAFKRQYAAA